MTAARRLDRCVRVRAAMMLVSLFASAAALDGGPRRPPSVTAAFDGGNIEVVEACAAPRPGIDTEFTLRIAPDAYTYGTDETAHFQWFSFRASGVRGRRCRFVVENAGGASYADGWVDYRTAASYDREDWWRVADTSYDGRELAWELTPAADSVYFAYFAPYSWERHADVVAGLAASPLCDHAVVGETLDGRPLDLLAFGGGPLRVWVTARQHPGESMAEWCAEGLLRRLADPDDAAAARLRAAATVYVLPNMNPDGAVRGYLRTNAAGANLNREWNGGVYEGYDAPSLERSPEVLYARRAMDEAGVDASVDIHGDEAIAANFFAGTEGIPSWDAGLAGLLKTLSDALLARSPDFQADLGYPVDSPGGANMAVASNAIAERYGCLAVTLEQPFKDHGPRPDARAGWSPERAMRLGSDLLDALLDAAPAIAAHKAAKEAP